MALRELKVCLLGVSAPRGARRAGGREGGGRPPRALRCGDRWARPSGGSECQACPAERWAAAPLEPGLVPVPTVRPWQRRAGNRAEGWGS